MTEKTESFTAEERAAMKERAKELREEGKRSKSADKAEAEAAEVLEKIAEMPDADRAIAEKIHRIVAEEAPSLSPKTWYGMPGWALDGKIVLFFQGSEKFKTRYATLGFNDIATIDDGSMWPTAFALTKLTAADEKALRALIKKSAG